MITKKIIAIILLIAFALILVLSLAACGTLSGNSDNDTPDGGNNGTNTPPAGNTPGGDDNAQSDKPDLANDLSPLIRGNLIGISQGENNVWTKDGEGINAVTWMNGNIEISVLIWLDGEYIITTTRIEGESRYGTDKDNLRGTWSYENYILTLDSGFEFILNPDTKEFTISVIPAAYAVQLTLTVAKGYDDREILFHITVPGLQDIKATNPKPSESRYSLFIGFSDHWVKINPLWYREGGSWENIILPHIQCGIMQTI